MFALNNQGHYIRQDPFNSQNEGEGVLERSSRCIRLKVLHTVLYGHAQVQYCISKIHKGLLTLAMFDYDHGGRWSPCCPVKTPAKWLCLYTQYLFIGFPFFKIEDFKLTFT